ncbi:MAG: hypothetical protein ACTS4U_01120 [Candidatus Hodgkinia cicadicola]
MRPLGEATYLLTLTCRGRREGKPIIAWERKSKSSKVETLTFWTTCTNFTALWATSALSISR